MMAVRNTTSLRHNLNMSEIAHDITNSSPIPKTPFAYFWYVSKPFKWWTLFASVCIIFAAGIDMGSTYIFKMIIDAVEVADHASAFTYALFYPAVVLVVQLLYRASGYAGGNLAVRTVKRNYDILTAQALQHSHSYFSNRFTGALMSKIHNVVDATDRLIQNMLWSHLNALVTLLVTFGFIIAVDWYSGLVFFALIIVLIILNRAMAPERMRLSKASAESATALRARLVDTFGNIQAVRQYARAKGELGRMQEFSTDYRNVDIKSWLFSEKMLLMNGLVLFAFSLAMFWFLVSGWKSGALSTGDLVLVLALYAQTTGLMIFIGRAFDQTARSIGQMKEGLEELLLPFDIVDTADAVPLLVTEATISWQQVNFAFQGKPVFADFSLHIPAGQRLGLVGQSGAGKTTFVSLLLRQHDIDAGAITIGGQNIAAVTQDSLRGAIAVVPQEPSLFHRTIRENILYGNPYATEEEMIAVAKKAQAHDFIMALPLGYDTLVGERGVKLSGGQKQRVAIARAMLKDAPILVLDEATSALDSESEVAIQKALETLMEGRTVIAIAHRLSTLRKMDRVIILEGGKILEDGTHETLTQAGGMYARLWNHQAGGFLQDV
jgi:ATP-binding cassette subfamily B protein